MRRIPGPLLLLIAAACGNPAAVSRHPTFVVARATYSPGDTVVAVLTNGTEQELGCNVCFTSLERRAGTSWVAVAEHVGLPQETGCLADEHILAPGAVEVLRWVIPSGTAAGTYRLWTEVEAPLQSPQQPVYTAAFAIAAP